MLKLMIKYLHWCEDCCSNKTVKHELFSIQCALDWRKFQTFWRT